MLHLIPTDIEEFNEFISRSDDHLQTMRTRTVYPLDAEGKTDYSAKNKKEVSEPVWQYLGWTEAQMKQWSLFRKHHDELYPQYKKAKGAARKTLQQQLDENIAACLVYDKEQGISERFITSGETYGIDRDAFGYQTDTIVHKTPLRSLQLNYEKRRPLSDFEKQFIDDYIELHKATPEYFRKLCRMTQEVHQALPELWSRFHIAKEKADLATNSIYIPAAPMQGEFSPTVCFKMPTAEEQQQRTDDFNDYMKSLVKTLNEVNAKYDYLYWAENEHYYYEGKEEEAKTRQNTFPLYETVSENVRKITHNWHKYSLDSSSVDSDFQDYLGSYSDMRKEFLAGFKPVADELSVVNDLYDQLVEYFNLKFKSDSKASSAQFKPDETFDDDISESDDLRAETLRNYLKGTGSPFHDVDDWHIILDHFNEKFDEKGKAEALEKAMSQHPENATLLLRKAQEEIDKHEYQKAQELVKRAEAKGEPFHPNLYFIKADIFMKMHAPEKAIPLYRKVLALKGYGLEPFYERARYRLLDIYEQQKNYDECIPLIKELMEGDPDDESLVSRLCNVYTLKGMLKEAEEMAKSALEKNPESAEGFRMQGRLLMEQKQYYKAAQEYEKAFNLDPSENYHDMFEAGKAFAESKNYQYAVLCFEICVFHFHLEKDFHIAAAECYNHLKMPYAAEFHYRKTLDLDPENTAALHKLNMPEN